MNKLWQQLAIATNWPVLAAIAVLTSIGICSIWADSPADGQKQLIFLGGGVAGMLLFHTHPSGDPSPSAEDLAFTRRLADAGDLLGVKLHDHVILGGGHRWVSLRRRGGW